MFVLFYRHHHLFPSPPWSSVAVLAPSSWPYAPSEHFLTCTPPVDLAAPSSRGPASPENDTRCAHCHWAC